MLYADQVVKVVASIAPSGLLRKEFGLTLFVTSDTTIPANERVRTYEGTESVAADGYAVDSQPYLAAGIYFQQNPYPKNLMVGRWFNTTEDVHVVGGTSHSAVAAFNAISDGAFNILVDLRPDYDTPSVTEYVISGLDFGASASLADVAAVVEAKLLTALNGNGFDVATVVYDTVRGGFVISIKADDIATIVTTGFALTPSVGTDVSEMLALTASTASYKESSTVIETITEAMNAIAAKDASFYFVTTENGTINDTTLSEDVSTWVASRAYMYSADSADVATLTKADSVFTRLGALNPPRTFGTWSLYTDYKAVSAAARMSSVNFNANNSLITLKFKDLVGTLPDATMNETQAGNLQDLGVNFYSERSGVPMYEEGYTFDKNVWIDVRFWLDWFVDAVRVEVFNLLKQSPSRVPQTEAGMNAIKQAVDTICLQGIANGGIAGGQLSPALTLDAAQSTGNASFDGFLANGYLIHAEPVATLSQSDRNERKVPPVQVWLKGSGAIHFVDVSIVFEN